MPSPSKDRLPPRCYLAEGAEALGARVPLSMRQYRHLIAALRRGAGDPVEWFDGRGGFGSGVLTGSDREGFAVEIASREVALLEPADRITLLLGLPKAESVPACLSHATQAGVRAIGCWFAERTPWRANAERLERVREKWEAELIDSSEQCGRLTIPSLVIATLDSLLARVDGATSLWVATPEPGTGNVPELLARSKGLLAIGPEGGLSPTELAALAAAGGQPWHVPGPTLTTTLACGLLPGFLRVGGNGGGPVGCYGGVTGRW